jgi:hypothetical protein
MRDVPGPSKVIPSLVHVSATSSKIEEGTVNGSVADTWCWWAATSSADRGVRGAATHP